MDFIAHKGFGFILDKDTREKVWFHKSSILQSMNGLPFERGVECIFEKVISTKGNKPGSLIAKNIRTLDGACFITQNSDIFI